MSTPGDQDPSEPGSQQDAVGAPSDASPGDASPEGERAQESAPDSSEVESVTQELRRAADLADVVGLPKARYDRATLLHKARVDGADTSRWWRAMGIVEVPDDVVAFNSDDLAMARALKVVLSQDDGSEEHVFRLARLLGGSFSRIAEAQTQVLEDLLTNVDPTVSLDTPAERAAMLGAEPAEALVDLFEQSMLYVWRRHLFAALGRWVGADADQDTQAVGFVDISGFSQMSKRVESSVLAEVVERFESEAVDVVSHHGGRVVKFIGDEAFFVVDDVDSAVDAALEIADRLRENDPPVALHTGISYGPTVTIAGDVFGTTVNLAKRLTDVARKGKVVLPKEDAEVLGERDDLVVKRVSRVFELKGIGRTSAVSVSRASPDE